MITLTVIGILIYLYGLYMFITDWKKVNWDINNLADISPLRFVVSGTSAAITVLIIILVGFKVIITIFHLIITYLP